MFSCDPLCSLLPALGEKTRCSPGPPMRKTPRQNEGQDSIYDTFREADTLYTSSTRSNDPPTSPVDQGSLKTNLPLFYSSSPTPSSTSGTQSPLMIAKPSMHDIQLKFTWPKDSLILMASLWSKNFAMAHTASTRQGYYPPNYPIIKTSTIEETLLALTEPTLMDWCTDSQKVIDLMNSVGSD